MQAEAFKYIAAPKEPVPTNTRIVYPSCVRCPYDRGEGFYCIGHCLREILKSCKNGG